ncbi:MAG: DNA repair protein RecO [Pseudomonadota bacterium]
MEWTDQGLVLARRRHGETAAIVSLLTRLHGRHLGLVRGGAGRRAGGLYEPGNLLAARWRARLDEHLGSYVCEPVEGFAARVLDDPLRLSALAAACALLEVTLAEREPHGALFKASLGLLRELAGAAPAETGWAAAYVRWECGLLADLGFGLDLERCAATGRTEGLAYVSPRSGRAVSANAGEAYAVRLLVLPAFLKPGAAAPDPLQILHGLELTGHFLERRLWAGKERQEPPARLRFVDRWRKFSTISCR